MKRREFLKRGIGAAAGAAALMAGIEGEFAKAQEQPSHGAQLLAKAFGAVGDGVTDDGPAVLKMLEAASKSNGPAILKFDSDRTYHLVTGRQRYAFLLDGVHDLTIDGSGSIFLIDSNQRFMKLANSHDVTVRRLKVDYSPLPFADGVIVAKDEAQGTIDVKIDAGLAMPPLGGPTKEDGEQEYFAMLKHAGEYSTPEEPYLTEQHYIAQDVREAYAGSTRDRVVRVVARDPSAGLFDPIVAGNWRVSVPVRGIAHRLGPGSSCAILNNTNVLFEDVEMWSAPWFAFTIIDNSGVVTFRRTHVRPKPGTTRLTSSWRDGFHVKNNRAVFLWDGCICQGMNDDAFNIFTQTSIVREVKSPTSIVIQQNYPLDIAGMRQGDMLTAYEMRIGHLLGSAKIVRVNEHAGAGAPGQLIAPLIEIELDRPISGIAVDSTMIWNEAVASSNSMIRGCRIDRSCQFHSPLTIEDTHINGVVWFHGDEHESPLPSNIHVTNSVLRVGQGSPNLSVVMNGPTFEGHSPAQPVMHDVFFTGNRIYGDFQISDVDNLVLTQNQFVDPSRMISFVNVTGLVLSGNTHGAEPYKGPTAPVSCAAWTAIKGSAPEVYYVAGGGRRYIGSMAVLADLGYGTSIATVPDEQLLAIPKLATVPDFGSRYVVAQKSGLAYWLDHGVKFPVEKSDESVFNLGVKTSVGDANLDIIPTAPRLWWPVKASDSADVVLICRGQRWKVYSMQWLYTQGFTDTDIREVSKDVLERYKDQGPMPGVDSALIQGDDGAVYALELGVKRPLTMPAQSAGITTSAKKVDGATLAFFPTGPAVGLK